ncbi:MAG: RecB family exonuclease [Nanoarchaeota archaeon]
MSHKAIWRMRNCSISRIQSSSSINAFRQCPRKYYYSYIEELPKKQNIYQIRGKIAHQLLEDFFKLDISKLPSENFEFTMKIFLQDMLSNLWDASSAEFSELGLSTDELEGYKQETQQMIHCWFLDFVSNLKTLQKNMGFTQAFNKLAPVSEEYFVSDEIGVQGYVDAIHKDENGIKILDYKTSKKDYISDDYRLQLAVYSLLYHEKYNEYPAKAGLYLLKHGERLLDVTENLLEFGRVEVEKVHLSTVSRDIRNYPKKQSILCNWGKGQCDFYEECRNFSI